MKIVIIRNNISKKSVFNKTEIINFGTSLLEDIKYSPGYTYINIDRNYKNITELLKDHPDLPTDKNLQKILL